jgi:hypothetical protein
LSKIEIVKHGNLSLIILLFVLFELILSTQNAQSNALLTGLTILAFSAFERGNKATATLFIVIGIYIKIFSVVGCLLILMYPEKLKTAIYFILWMVILFAMPLMVVDFPYLLQQYKNWYTMLQLDHGRSFGMSLFSYLPLNPNASGIKNISLLAGIILMSLPLFQQEKFFNAQLRLNYLSLLLIGMVVLNYKSESPTFIIAMTGISVWFFTNKSNYLSLALSILALVFTSLWFTDLVPKYLKANFFNANILKPLFPSLIFVYLLVGLIFRRSTVTNSEREATASFKK